MSRALRLTKWLALPAALFALACALFAPVEAGVARRATPQNARAPREEKPPEPEESVVRGRVVYDDTTRPVRRARVMLIKENNVGRSEYAALTDAGGDFVIWGVRAGVYYAFVDVPGVLSPVGFVSLETLRASPGTFGLGEGRRFFDLVEVDGKRDVNVTVHARRGASIAGRVTHADGDPAVNVSVNLLRRSSDGRVQKYLPGASAAALSGLRTDDRGMFRLTGLPPGEYLIGVNEAVNHGSPFVGARSAGEDLSGLFRGMFTPQLLMTFYPSATSLKEAGVIKVGPGDERADADIRIPERDLRLVGGVVRARRGGRPVGLASVTITRRDDPLSPGAPLVPHYEGSEYEPNSTTTNDEGRWWLFEVPDGSYTITVRPPEEYEEAPAVASVNMNTSDANANVVAGVTNTNTSEYRPPRRKRSYAPTRVNLEVSGGDVTEFVVEVAEGARVAGTVTVEGGGKPAYWHVSVMRVGEGGAVHEEEGQAEVVGTRGSRFAVEGLSAGKFLIQPTLVGGDDEEDEELYLKSIMWNGRDLLRTPLELAEGASVEGVRIVYGRNPATLRVTVRGAGRRQAEEFLIAVVPTDLSAWSPYGEQASCLTEGGACEVSAPPGEYRVLAMRTPEGPEDYEQEVRRRAPNAVRVTLREGETGRVEVDAPGN
jgi:hypothetical protein